VLCVEREPLVCRNDVDEADDVQLTSNVTLRRHKNSSSGERPTSIAERLSQLYESQESWKSKVEEKDMDQFTVEGKINRLGQSDYTYFIGQYIIYTFQFHFNVQSCKLANIIT